MQVKGTHWEYVDDELKNKYTQNKKYRHSICGATNTPAIVVCIDTEKIFNSASDAARFFGISSVSLITNCCKGLQKTAGGYHWRYATEEEKENM